MSIYSTGYWYVNILEHAVFVVCVKTTQSLTVVYVSCEHKNYNKVLLQLSEDNYL